MTRGFFAPLLATLLVLASAAAAQAATITVTRTDDPSTAGDCLSGDTDCSLRQAIVAEDGTSAGGDTISLGSHTYTLTQGTDLDITKPLVLAGAGVGSTTIDGSNNYGARNGPAYDARILRVDSGATGLLIQGMTFTGGYDFEDENCCETVNANGGGDLFNNGGGVTLKGVAFTNNVSSGTPLGGAVSNGSGTLTMDNVSFTHNEAAGGGALFTRNGTVTGNGVTFSNDVTSCCEGGAAYLLGGTVTLANTTIVSSGGYDGGGAIANGGAQLSLDNVTLSDNGADIQTDLGNATTAVENTILGSACVAPGRTDELNNRKTGSAITTDLGENIDRGSSCGLSADGDKSSTDPKLVPLANNGGPTLTEALIAGSPALGDPSTTDCPSKDQRGEPRGDGNCDIGAFEAQPTTAPNVPTTDAATNVTKTSADLAGTINLNGDAGGFHFLYGTSSDQSTWTALPESAAGVVSEDTPASYALTGLSPGTTYYYAVVADNATASVEATGTQQFTTPDGSPYITNVYVETETDTTANIDFTIDPQGEDTTYYVKYGTDSLNQQTDSSTAPAASGAQSYGATLTNLSPGTTYYYEVVASNSAAPDGVTSQQSSFATDLQVTGTAGSPVSIIDSGSSDSCPQAPTVDWGDGSQPDHASVTCRNGQYTTTDSHTYATPGHYLIKITYAELGQPEQYAQISPASSPTITGVNPTSGTTAGGTSV
ncbi:MAG: fibronectin type III domain-containing protein, partial [Solirubrobacterales bacterium]|nr:fibronectin type III domain-containing protein [Solirubrobacterales bacterium]